MIVGVMVYAKGIKMKCVVLLKQGQHKNGFMQFHIWGSPFDK